MKKQILKFATILSSVGVVGATAVSCGATVESDTKNISENKKDGKTIDNYTFEKFFNQIKKTDKKNSKNISSVFDLSAKYLYLQEQEASEKDKILREDYIRWDNRTSTTKEINKKVKDANIKALDTEDKIEKSVRSEFADKYQAFKNTIGRGWEKAWPAELSRSYQGATSSEEAIEHLITARMQSRAYSRFILKKQTSSYTKEQLDFGKISLDPIRLKALKDSTDDESQTKYKFAIGYKWIAELEKNNFVYSSNKNKNISQLMPTDNISIVMTSSFADEHKSPSEIIGTVNSTSTSNSGTGYLGNFDPTYISHFLIPAKPDANDKLKPWKIDIKSLKKLLYSSGNSRGILDDVSEFSGVHEDASQPNGHKTWSVKDEDSNLLNILSGNKDKTAGGSLGLQDYLSYVKTMDPGFSIPLLNDFSLQASSTAAFTKNTTNPLKGLTEKLVVAISKMPGNTAITAATLQNKTPTEWQDTVDAYISAQDEKDILNVAGRVFLSAFGDAATKHRSVVYKGSGSGADETIIVLSSFGIHIMKVNQLKGSNAQKDLVDMMRSDNQRSSKSKSEFFNVIKELNQYSTNKQLIVKELLQDTKFKDYLKKQTDYNAKPAGNIYPKYNDVAITKVIDALNAYNSIYKSKRSRDAVDEHDSKYLNDFYWQKELVNESGWDQEKWTESLKQLYSIAKEISRTGVVK